VGGNHEHSCQKRRVGFLREIEPPVVPKRKSLTWLAVKETRIARTMRRTRKSRQRSFCLHWACWLQRLRLFVLSRGRASVEHYAQSASLPTLLHHIDHLFKSIEAVHLHVWLDVVLMAEVDALLQRWLSTIVGSFDPKLAH